MAGAIIDVDVEVEVLMLMGWDDDDDSGWKVEMVWLKVGMVDDMDDDGASGEDPPIDSLLPCPEE